MLTWLVIGVGDITSRRVLPAILAEERSRLVGIVTRNPAKAAPYGVPAHTTLEAALAESEAAAIFVGSPVFLHAPQSIAALAAGRHVLCEKPMAMNLAEAEKMVAEARASRRTFGVAYYRRAYPKVHRALGLIRRVLLAGPCLLGPPATRNRWPKIRRDHGFWTLSELAGGRSTISLRTALIY